MENLFPFLLFIVSNLGNSSLLQLYYWHFIEILSYHLSSLLSIYLVPNLMGFSLLFIYFHVSPNTPETRKKSGLKDSRDLPFMNRWMNERPNGRDVRSYFLWIDGNGGTVRRERWQPGDWDRILFIRYPMSIPHLSIPHGERTWDPKERNHKE